MLAFASSKVDAGDFTAADQALAALAPLIAGLAAGTDSATRSRTGAVNYAKARLAWLAARKKAQGEIERLRQAIRSAFAPGATSDDAADDELSSDDAEALDDALNAAEDDRRLALNRQAQAQIADFLGDVESEPLLLNLDDNPFLPVTVQATLQATLRTLAATLKV